MLFTAQEANDLQIIFQEIHNIDEKKYLAEYVRKEISEDALKSIEFLPCKNKTEVIEWIFR